jgi:hypothetical protein
MLNHYDLSLYVGWFEIPRDFIGLPELYGLKCENLITSVIILYLCSYNLDGSVTTSTPPNLFNHDAQYYYRCWPFRLH